MKPSILVRGARQLVTLQGRSGPRRGVEMRELSVIQDGSVLITDGVIQRVGPTRQVENVAEARAAEEINAAGRVVMPAFVDANCHVVTAPPRVAAAGRNSFAAASSDTLEAAVHWVRNASPTNLEAQARRWLESAVRHGTLTVETRSGHGLSSAAEMKILRVLASLGNGLLAVVPTFSGALALSPEFQSPREYLESLSTDMLPKLRDRKFIRYVDAQCDSGGFTADELRPYLTAAARLGFPLRLQGDGKKRSGGAALALEFGAVSVSGLNEASDADVDLIARSATTATLMPTAVHAAGCRRLPPARAMLDRGAVVALASGFMGCARSTLNMQTVVSAACAELALTVEEAISAATVNAAHAVGRGGACGTLECGRDADLLILDVSDYRDIPLQFGSNLAALVMRRGETVWQQGPVTCERWSNA
jgi:imidazolonepropionase